MLKPVLTPRYKGAVLFFDLLSFVASSHLVNGLRFSDWGFQLEQSLGFWFMAMTLLSSLYIFGSFDLDTQKLSTLMKRQFIAVFSTLLIVLLINYILSKERSGIFGRGILFGTLIIFWFLSSMYKGLLWNRLKIQISNLKYLFIAHADYTKLINEEIINKFSFASVVFVPSLEKGSIQAGRDLNKIINKDWTSIILALPSKYWNTGFSDILMKTRFAGASILNLDDFFEGVQKKVPVDFLNQEWFIFEKGFSLINNPFGLRIKRLCDMILALGLLLLSWPVIILAAILIKLESPGSVFYKQIRTGLNDHEFTIFKLRSMAKNAEVNGVQWAQNNDSRVTRVGKWLRLTRIDELPQLWNVVKGEMSFIGPRPERPEFNIELEEKIPFYRLRHLVRPGITGWAQVMYPYGASIEDSKQKLQFDLYYIKNFSFFLDLQIVFKTIQVVLFGKGR